MSALQYNPSEAEIAKLNSLKKLWDDAIVNADVANDKFQKISLLCTANNIANLDYNGRVTIFNAFGSANTWFSNWKTIPGVAKTSDGNLDRTFYVQYYSDKLTAANTAIAAAQKVFEDYQAVLDKKANEWIKNASPALQAEAEKATAESNQKLGMYAIIGIVILIIGFIAYKKLK